MMEWLNYLTTHCMTGAFVPLSRGSVHDTRIEPPVKSRRRA